MVYEEGNGEDKVKIMGSALLSKRRRRVDVMKGYEPMYDATMQECLQRPFYLYARGKGRSCRKEIWVFSVFVWVIGSSLTDLFSSTPLAFLPGLFSLAMLVPVYALMVRRLHDLALSGWLALVPYVLVLAGLVADVGLLMSDDPDPSPSPLATVLIVLAVIFRLAIMCIPSRRHRPSVDNGNIGAGQPGPVQYPRYQNGR